MRFHSRIKKIEQKRRAVRGYVDQDSGQTMVEYEDIGWFIMLDGSWESWYVGKEQPDFKIGQAVSVTISIEEATQ